MSLRPILSGVRSGAGIGQGEQCISLPTNVGNPDVKPFAGTQNQGSEIGLRPTEAFRGQGVIRHRPGRQERSRKTKTIVIVDTDLQIRRSGHEGTIQLDPHGTEGAGHGLVVIKAHCKPVDAVLWQRPCVAIRAGIIVVV